MLTVNEKIKEAYNKFTTQRKSYIKIGDNSFFVQNLDVVADAYFDGNVIGNAIAKIAKFDIETEYVKEINEFELFDGIWTGNQYEYVSLGTFKLFNEKGSDDFFSSITAYDKLIHFNKEYDSLQTTFPITLFNLLRNVCEQAGVELENTSLPNGDQIIKENLFVENETLKQLLNAICQINGCFGIISKDKLKLLLKGTNTINLSKYQISNPKYKRTTWKINQVILGMADIDGEYVLRQNDDDIQKNGIHKLVINNNPFVYTQDLREKYIDNLFNQVNGFGYTAFETIWEGLPYVELGDLLNFDGKESLVLRYNLKSPNGLKSTLAAPSIIDSIVEYVDNSNSIKNKQQRTEYIVDKHNQQINQIISKQDNHSNQLVSIKTTLDGIKQEVSEVTETTAEIQDNINIKGTAKGNPLYLEDCAEKPLLKLEIDGNSEQETRSKINIFDGVVEKGSINGTSGETTTSNNRIRNVNFIKVQSNTDYILNMINNNLKLYVFEYDISGTFIQRIPNNWTTEIPFIFTTSPNTQKIKFIFAFNDDSEINVSDVSNIELYEPIMPSPNYPSEIKVVEGYNLLPNNATSQTINNVNFIVNNDKTVIANGTPLDGNVNFEINLITLPAGNYFLSGCPAGGNYETYRIFAWDESWNSVAIDIGNGANFTLNNKTTLRITLSILNGITVKELLFKPMITKDTTKKDYVPYNHLGIKLLSQLKQKNYYIDLKENFAGKVNDVKDELSIVGNKAILKKNIQRVIFTGDEIWEYNSTYNYFRCPTYEYLNLPNNTLSDRICTHFEIVDSWVNFRDSNNNGAYITNDGYKICIRNTEFTTVDNFKNWLKEQSENGNPVYTDYVVIEPYEVDLGNVELETFEGVNNIFLLSSLDTDMYCEYIRNTQFNSVYQDVTGMNNYYKKKEVDTIVEQTVEGVNTTISNVENIVNKNTNEIEKTTGEIAIINETIKGMQIDTSKIGGNNLLKNAIGCFGQNSWEGGGASPYSDTYIKNKTGQRSCWLLNNGTHKQVIQVKNGIYTLSFMFEKLISASEITFKLNDKEYELEKDNLITFEVTNNTITVEFNGNANLCAYLMNLMLNEGTIASPYSNNANETVTDSITLGEGIFRISSTGINTEFMATANAIGFENKNTGEMSTEFSTKGTSTNELTATKATIAKIIIKDTGSQTIFNRL